MRVSDKANFP